MNKLHNTKINVDGLTFDSQKEFRRWHELKLLDRVGEISNLQRQVKFVLIPKSKWGRERNYIADFVYIEKGQTIVEDVKGYKGGATYEVFKLKKRLFEEKYNIEIKVI